MIDGLPDANAARNAGAARARGDLIVFIDDDVLLPPGWLRALADGAERWPRVDCFGGPVRPIFESEPRRMCTAHGPAGGRFDEGLDEKPVREVWGGNMAIRRSALGRVGPFREGLRVHQEWEWQLRLRAGGGSIVYLPGAWLWHRHRLARLQFGAMLRDSFVRGYVRASLDPEVTLAYVARRTARWLSHAGAARCARGVTETARSAGLLSGVVRRTGRHVGRAPRTRRAGASA